MGRGYLILVFAPWFDYTLSPGLATTKVMAYAYLTLDGDVIVPT